MYMTFSPIIMFDEMECQYYTIKQADFNGLPVDNKVTMDQACMKPYCHDPHSHNYQIFTVGEKPTE